MYFRKKEPSPFPLFRKKEPSPFPLFKVFFNPFLFYAFLNMGGMAASFTILKKLTEKTIGLYYINLTEVREAFAGKLVKQIIRL